MYLGLDIGTSAVKAIIIDDAGILQSQASAPLQISRPHPLWSEQNPEDWWQAVIVAVNALPTPLRSAVRGIGLAGQMHGAVLLDAIDTVLRPAILWNDGRAASECALFESRAPNSPAITGNIAMPGFTAPKLIWVAANEPAIFARVARVLLPKDYIRLRLTGDYASDMSDSSGTLWLDVGKRRWSEAMLAASGLDERAMPRLCEGDDVTGWLTDAAATALGLSRVPVVAGGGDNAAGAIGAGVVHPGEAFLSLGTSGVIFAVSDGFAPAPDRAVHSFCHALPGRWHQMAVILSAAACLEWGARLTGQRDVAAALAPLENGPEPADVPLFLPYLSGERTPHNDPQARGVLFGLTHDHGPNQIMRAILEGVAFALADGADALRATGTRLETLRVIGGGARSKLWGRIVASATGCRLDYAAGADVGPALGAALLARLGIGGAGFPPPAPIGHSIVPDVSLIDQLQCRRERFRDLYARLRPAFTSENLE
jgi:xylulokinase